MNASGTLRKIAGLLLACTMAAPAAMASDQTAVSRPSLTVNAPQAKEFTLISHYHFLERDYLPTVVLPRMAEPPKAYQFAEEVLISQFSARDTLDYDWWLGTWDEAAQKKLSERMESAKKTKKDWRDEMTKNAGVRVLLTRWMLSGDYVILAYKVLPAEADAKAMMAAQETTTAFRLTAHGWRATLDLEDDPVLLHFNDSKAQFERVVRPQ